MFGFSFMFNTNRQMPNILFYSRYCSLSYKLQQKQLFQKRQHLPKQPKSLFFPPRNHSEVHTSEKFFTLSKVLQIVLQQVLYHIFIDISILFSFFTLWVCNLHNFHNLCNYHILHILCNFHNIHNLRKYHNLQNFHTFRKLHNLCSFHKLHKFHKNY